MLTIATSKGRAYEGTGRPLAIVRRRFCCAFHTPRSVQTTKMPSNGSRRRGRGVEVMIGKNTRRNPRGKDREPARNRLDDKGLACAGASPRGAARSPRPRRNSPRARGFEAIARPPCARPRPLRPRARYSPFPQPRADMTWHRWLPLASLTAATLTLACSHGSASSSSSMGMGGMDASPALASMGKGYDENVVRDLGRLRAATDKFHDLKAAQEVGYPT